MPKEDSDHVGFLRKWLTATYHQYREREWRLTLYLVVIIVTIFGIQGGLMIIGGAPSIQALVAFGFVHVPELMWPLAVFLHRDGVHLATNAFMLLALAPAEQYLSRRIYLLLFLVAGFGSIVAGGSYFTVFGTKDTVAYYGTSGFVYGLAGFTLVHHMIVLSDRVEVDWLGILVGISGAYVVTTDLYYGLTIGPMQLNPGHVFGYAVGIILALGWIAVHNNQSPFTAQSE